MKKEKKPPRSPLATRFSGPARETEARLRSLFRFKRNPPAVLVALALAAAVGCGGLVSCQSGEGEFGPVVITTGGDTSAPSASESSQPAPEDSFELESFLRDALEGLNLDGAGGNDDAVTVTSYGPPAAEEEWTTVVEASLGDGRTLVWEYPYPCYPAAMAGYLTSTDHQCVVVEMYDRGSTYGFAAYFVLEVEGDALVERVHLGSYSDPDAINYGGGDTVGVGDIVQREDSPLQALRVPTLYTDKWHDSLYGNLYWDGGAFVFKLDAIAPLIAEPHPSEPDLDAEAREAYALALEGLVKRHVFPDGTACDSMDSTYGDMEDSGFLVHDVDMDGLDELIVNYRGEIMAGMRGLILGYDPATGGVYTELDEFPAFTFYSNGTIAAGWSHNQGLGGDFWPYNLYQYDRGADVYRQVGTVDAFDKKLVDPEIWGEYDNPPYPEEADVSKSGFVYYIMEGGYDTSHPVDVTIYQEWLNGYTGGTRPLVLEELPLTMENIQRLREGGTA